MTPGASLRAARQALGLSLQGLAELLLIRDRQTLRRYEDGSREPSGPVLVAMAYLCRERGLDPAAFGLVIPKGSDRPTERRPRAAAGAR